MSLIKIENLSFSYYGYLNDVFDDVSFSFDTNWKTGLIGRNGIGKSTFFKLLLGEEKYQGKINKSVECTKFPPDIKDETSSAIEFFNSYINNNSEEWRFFKELNLLEIDESLAYAPLNTLSKGERTEILLAVLFTTQNEFLLIDEPTNHLDIAGRNTVAKYLKSKKGFLLISHDRNFLDVCIDHVISLNKNSIDVQTGNFTSWYENKMKKDQYEMDENERLKKDIRRLKESARQSKQWSDKVEKTKMGQKVSGVKPDKGYIGHQSAKMMKKSKNLEKRQNKAIEDKENLLKDVEKKEELKLKCLKSHKDVLFKIEKLSAYYADRQILNNVNLEIRQEERIAIYGKNGCGKSTLLEILLGEDISHTGELQKANNLKISYISQDISDLSGDLSEYIKLNDVDETLCKTILRKLDFSRELFDIDMVKYSDGQKKKVLIAVSLSKEAHIFIWDEPLNYIDVISRMQIEEILLNSKPTLIFVEHDKKFVDAIATKIAEL